MDCPFKTCFIPSRAQIHRHSCTLGSILTLSMQCHYCLIVYLSLMARAHVQANITDLDLYPFNCKHIHLHTKTACKQTYTDIPTHITRIHTQTTFIHTCEEHTKNKHTFNATLLVWTRARYSHTKTLDAVPSHAHTHTHTFTFDFVSLVKADLTVPLGRMRAGGHKHAPRYGAIETSPLPGRCALTADGARPVQRHENYKTSINAHLLQVREDLNFMFMLSDGYKLIASLTLACHVFVCFVHLCLLFGLGTGNGFGHRGDCWSCARCRRASDPDR